MRCDPVGHDMRLCRLLRGKALPFREAGILNSLLHAGWEAQPSSLRGRKMKGQESPGKAKPFRTAGRRSRSVY
jgi:hypothetical protein